MRGGRGEWGGLGGGVEGVHGGGGGGRGEGWGVACGCFFGWRWLGGCCFWKGRKEIPMEFWRPLFGVVFLCGFLVEGLAGWIGGVGCELAGAGGELGDGNGKWKWGRGSVMYRCIR